MPVPDNHCKTCQCEYKQLWRFRTRDILKITLVLACVWFTAAFSTFLGFSKEKVYKNWDNVTFSLFTSVFAMVGLSNALCWYLFHKEGVKAVCKYIRRVFTINNIRTLLQHRQSIPLQEVVIQPRRPLPPLPPETEVPPLPPKTRINKRSPIDELGAESDSPLLATGPSPKQPKLSEVSMPSSKRVRSSPASYLSDPNQASTSSTLSPLEKTMYASPEDFANMQKWDLPRMKHSVLPSGISKGDQTGKRSKHAKTGAVPKKVKTTPDSTVSGSKSKTSSASSSNQMEPKINKERHFPGSMRTKQKQVTIFTDPKQPKSSFATYVPEPKQPSSGYTPFIPDPQQQSTSRTIISDSNPLQNPSIASSFGTTDFSGSMPQLDLTHISVSASDLAKREAESKRKDQEREAERKRKDKELRSKFAKPVSTQPASGSGSPLPALTQPASDSSSTILSPLQLDISSVHSFTGSTQQKQSTETVFVNPSDFSDSMPPLDLTHISVSPSDLAKREAESKRKEQEREAERKRKDKELCSKFSKSAPTQPPTVSRSSVPAPTQPASGSVPPPELCETPLSSLTETEQRQSTSSHLAEQDVAKSSCSAFVSDREQSCTSQDAQNILNATTFGKTTEPASAHTSNLVPQLDLSHIPVFPNLAKFEADSKRKDSECRSEHSTPTQTPPSAASYLPVPVQTPPAAGSGSSSKQSGTPLFSLTGTTQQSTATHLAEPNTAKSSCSDFVSNQEPPSTRKNAQNILKATSSGKTIESATHFSNLMPQLDLTHISVSPSDLTKREEESERKDSDRHSKPSTGSGSPLSAHTQPSCSSPTQSPLSGYNVAFDIDPRQPKTGSIVADAKPIEFASFASPFPTGNTADMSADEFYIISKLDFSDINVPSSKLEESVQSTESTIDSADSPVSSPGSEHIRTPNATLPHSQQPQTSPISSFPIGQIVESKPEKNLAAHSDLSDTGIPLSRVETSELSSNLQRTSEKAESSPIRSTLVDESVKTSPAACSSSPKEREPANLTSFGHAVDTTQGIPKSSIQPDKRVPTSMLETSESPSTTNISKLTEDLSHGAAPELQQGSPTGSLSNMPTGAASVQPTSPPSAIAVPRQVSPSAIPSYVRVSSAAVPRQVSVVGVDPVVRQASPVGATSCITGYDAAVMQGTLQLSSSPVSQQVRPVDATSVPRQIRPVADAPSYVRIGTASESLHVNPISQSSSCIPVGASAAPRQVSPVGASAAPRQVSPVGASAAPRQASPVGASAAPRQASPTCTSGYISVSVAAIPRRASPARVAAVAQQARLFSDTTVRRQDSEVGSPAVQRQANQTSAPSGYIQFVDVAENFSRNLNDRSQRATVNMPQQTEFVRSSTSQQSETVILASGSGGIARTVQPMSDMNYFFDQPTSVLDLSHIEVPIQPTRSDVAESEAAVENVCCCKRKEDDEDS